MQKNPIGWVEIPVTDLDRAEKFYKEYFGFEFQRQSEMNGFTMSWFPMDMEGYGSAGTLMKGPSYVPSYNGSIVYFAAPEGSVEKGLAKAQEHGIKIILPKMNIGENGFVAFIEDSEGNRIAIHSMVG